MSMIDLEKVKALQNNILALKESSLGKDDFLHLFVENAAGALNIYFVGIYFVDELKENLVFHVGNGLIGERLLKRKYIVKLAEKTSYANQISPAAFHDEIRFVDWGGRKIISCAIDDKNIFETDMEVIHDDKYFCSPNLPESFTEIYLPLRVQNKAIGILELNFNIKLPYSRDEIQILQLLANKLAELID